MKSDRRIEIEIGYEGAGRLVGMYKKRADSTKVLIHARTLTEGPMPSAMALANEIEGVRAGREAERAIADQWAQSLLDGPLRSDRRHGMYGSEWDATHAALDAYGEIRRKRWWRTGEGEWNVHD